MGDKRNAYKNLVRKHEAKQCLRTYGRTWESTGLLKMTVGILTTCHTQYT